MCSPPPSCSAITPKCSCTHESFYGGLPQLFFKEIIGFDISPGRISWKTVTLATQTSSFDSLFANKKIRENTFFLTPFVVSSGHDTYVKQNRWFRGGAIVASVSLIDTLPLSLLAIQTSMLTFISRLMAVDNMLTSTSQRHTVDYATKCTSGDKPSGDKRP